MSSSYTLDNMQSEIFKAIEKTRLLVGDKKESHYSRCGRTDKGVSAVGQVSWYQTFLFEFCRLIIVKLVQLYTIWGFLMLVVCVFLNNGSNWIILASFSESQVSITAQDARSRFPTAILDKAKIENVDYGLNILVKDRHAYKILRTKRVPMGFKYSRWDTILVQTISRTTHGSREVLDVVMHLPLMRLSIPSYHPSKNEIIRVPPV